MDGRNDVAICSTDVGGNSSSCVRRTVTVDNSCPGSGGTGAAILDAGADIRGKLSDRAAIRSNEHPVVRGALKDGAGNPVSGAAVCIYETIDLADASHELVSKVTTQSNGRFATTLDAGPSRQLDFVYRHNNGVLRDDAELDSVVVPTLAIAKKRLANGQAEGFTGRLPGPNADGRAVALQARAGRKWRTFKQLRTDVDGGFRGKYRFTQTIGRIRYSFRALVKRQGGYPYEPGHSRKRKVRSVARRNPGFAHPLAMDPTSHRLGQQDSSLMASSLAGLCLQAECIRDNRLIYRSAILFDIPAVSLRGRYADAPRCPATAAEQPLVVGRRERKHLN